MKETLVRGFFWHMLKGWEYIVYSCKSKEGDRYPAQSVQLWKMSTLGHPKPKVFLCTELRSSSLLFTPHKSGQTLESLKVNGLRALDINKEERLTDFDQGSTSSVEQQSTPSFLHGLGATTLQEFSAVIASWIVKNMTILVYSLLQFGQI